MIYSEPGFQISDAAFARDRARGNAEAIGVFLSTIFAVAHPEVIQRLDSGAFEVWYKQIKADLIVVQSDSLLANLVASAQQAWLLRRTSACGRSDDTAGQSVVIDAVAQFRRDAEEIRLLELGHFGWSNGCDRCQRRR